MILSKKQIEIELHVGSIISVRCYLLVPNPRGILRVSAQFLLLLRSRSLRPTTECYLTTPRSGRINFPYSTVLGTSYLL
jgi:hypothetical protein